ncbi:MAG TPA: hypothetical protein VHC69_17035 [Polyangiaceae bacterium]|nr:hypothetical protein [Polyangiaceae bacterium]
MKTSPLQAVKERFGDKEKLVAAVKALATEDLWLPIVNEVKGLERVSNAKLLRLHETLTRVKKDFGSRGKLIDSILTLGKSQKDAGLKGRLERLPTPRLVDLHASANRRAKGEEKTKAKAAKAPAKKKKARTKKAKAKAASGAPAATKTTKKK